MNLDEKDRVIMTMYAADPNVSQEDIASKIGLSQPSVNARIRKLKENGGLATHTGIDPLKMGLYLAKVDIACKDSRTILEMFRGCPYFANGYTVSGTHNVLMFFVGENIATLEAIVNNHIRSHASVKEVDFNIIISSEKEIVLPTKLTSERTNKPPCGVHQECSTCESFNSKRCMGCPATGQYQGWFY